MTDLDKIKLFQAISENSIKNQIDSKKGYQSSATQGLAFATVFITVLLFFIDKLSLCVYYLLPAIFLELISIFLLLRVIMGYEFFIGVHEKLFEKIYIMDEIEVETFIMNANKSSVEYNSENLKKMRKMLNIALIIMGITTSYLIILLTQTMI